VIVKYRRSLQSDRRHMLEQFAMVQVARKVVGVGSVDTRAWIVLMEPAPGASRDRRPGRGRSRSLRRPGR
jgi:uncharacterized protein (DUF2252 family)